MRPIAVFFLVVLLAGPASADRHQVPESRAEITLTFAPLVREVAPAVVNIYARRTVTTGVRSPLFNDPLFRRFFGRDFPGRPRQREQPSLGSGVIVRPDGLVVTNHHVVENAQEIRVVLADGTDFDATLALSDESTDLALLRLDDAGARTLPVVALGDSDDLAVGDLVLAIGNPFGVGQTVTSGIVSATARTAQGISDYSFFIQTDAAINPGNSGGALIDMAGRLVGINTAIYSRSGGSLGIGFAIPVNMVRAVIDSVDRGTPLLRPWLGADGQDLSAALADSVDRPRPGGVLIHTVVPGGPAERAGLRVGDIVLGIDGQPVNGAEALRFRIATLPLGGEAALEVWRGGDTLTLTLPVEPPPEDPPRNTTLLAGRHPLVGAVVANLSPALIAELRYAGPVRHGVIVLEVRRRSPAARLGLRAGDLIHAVEGAAVDSVADLEDRLAARRSSWRLTIQRDGRLVETVIRG